MTLPRTLALVTLSMAACAAVLAQAPFPGLKSVLTEAEWKRSGLDKLTPDQIGVIDAALIRQQMGATAQLRSEVATAQAKATAAESANGVAAVSGKDRSRGWLERFGLPISLDDDWRSMPPLKAKVVAWESGNRFKLDNGQLWEGFEPIPYDLVGKEIEIQARPRGQFALTVEGKNTALRVLRLR